MKLRNGGHVRLRAPEGDERLPDLGVIAAEGPSAAVYLTGPECIRLGARLHEMGFACIDPNATFYKLAEAVAEKSKDARFCIVCLADAIDDETFAHEPDCPVAQLESAA